ncbi:MAG: single-stranded DNA-binding protein [Actinomycetota bacterium]|nr:single-stranded DNA-binding protein [Actinomycetota bacterium]
MRTATEGSGDNHIFLRGSLTGRPLSRSPLSAGESWSFQLTVTREHGTHVDTIDCCTKLARVRRTVENAGSGDELVVLGSLRRRFWRSPAGLVSRYEVDVVSVRISSR